MIPKTAPVIKNCSDGIPAIQERKPSLLQKFRSFLIYLLKFSVGDPVSIKFIRHSFLPYRIVRDRSWIMSFPSQTRSIHSVCPTGTI